MTDWRKWDDWVATLLSKKELKTIREKSRSKEEAEMAVREEIDKKLKDKFERDVKKGKNKAQAKAILANKDHAFDKIWNTGKRLSKRLLAKEDILGTYVLPFTQRTLEEKYATTEVNRAVKKTKEDLANLDSTTRNFQKAMKQRRAVVMKELEEEMKDKSAAEIATAKQQWDDFYNQLTKEGSDAIKQMKKDEKVKLGEIMGKEVKEGKFTHLKELAEIQQMFEKITSPEKYLESLGVENLVALDEKKKIVYKLPKKTIFDETVGRERVVGDTTANAQKAVREAVAEGIDPYEFQRLIDIIKKYGLMPAKGKNSFHKLIDEYAKKMKREGKPLSDKRMKELRIPAYRIATLKRLPKQFTQDLSKFPETVRPVLRAWIEALPPPKGPPAKVEKILKKVSGIRTIKRITKKDSEELAELSAAARQEFRDVRSEYLKTVNEMKQLKKKKLPIPRALEKKSVDLGEELGSLAKWHNIIKVEAKKAKGLLNPKKKQREMVISAINLAVRPPSKLKESGELKAIRTAAHSKDLVDIGNFNSIKVAGDDVTKTNLVKAGLPEAQAIEMTKRIKALGKAIDKLQKTKSGRVRLATPTLTKSLQQDIKERKEELATIKKTEPAAVAKIKEPIIKSEIDSIQQEVKELQSENLEARNPWKLKKKLEGEDFVVKVDQDMQKEIHKLVNQKVLPTRALIELEGERPVLGPKKKKKGLEEIISEETEEAARGPSVVKTVVQK